MHHECCDRPTSVAFNAEESRIVREIDEDEIIRYLRMLVSIPSIFGSEHRISEQIAEDFRSFGFEVETVPVADCGPCVVGVGSRTNNPDAALPVLVFNGHMDTVPVCDGWTRDPFSPTVEQGRLYEPTL